MKLYILENMENIISIITVFITWIMGLIIKKYTNIKNKLIPIQNIIIMLLSVIIYYYATGNISAVIASSSPVATLIYDTIHNIFKSDNVN